jgi:hypothetical protein
VNGEGDAVVDSDLAQQAADVRLDGALVDAEGEGDLAVGASGAQQFEDLDLARGERGGELGALLPPGLLSSRRESTRRGAQTEPSRTISMAIASSDSLAARVRYPLAPAPMMRWMYS